MDLKANIFMYKYSCSRWYGYQTGLKNIIVDDNLSDEQVINLAKLKAEYDSSSKTCDIYLLQKFNAVFTPCQSYNDIVGIPFDTSNNLKNMLSKNIPKEENI